MTDLDRKWASFDPLGWTGIYELQSY